MNQALNESQHINDKLFKATHDIVEKIIEQTEDYVSSTAPLMSRVNRVSYFENEFDYNVKGIFKNIEKIRVKYLVYLFSNQYECDYSLANNRKLQFICYADDKTNTIMVSSYLVKMQPPSDLYESIAHELQHLFEYGHGMKKNVSLYDNMVSALNNAKTQYEYDILMCLYYSFPHEQTAFLQQYYQKLHRSFRVDSFEDSIRQTGLSDFKKRLNNVCFLNKENNTYTPKNIKQFEDTLSKIGMSYKHWEKRVKKGYEYFLYRFSNAYNKFATPLREYKDVGTYLKIKSMIYEMDEKSKNKIGIETIYDFGTEEENEWNYFE